MKTKPRGDDHHVSDFAIDSSHTSEQFFQHSPSLYTSSTLWQHRENIKLRCNTIVEPKMTNQCSSDSTILNLHTQVLCRYPIMLFSLTWPTLYIHIKKDTRLRCVDNDQPQNNLMLLSSLLTNLAIPTQFFHYALFFNTTYTLYSH